MIHGAYGPIHPFAIEGWACNDSSPTSKILIEFLVDGIKIGETITNGDAELLGLNSNEQRQNFFANFSNLLPYTKPERITVIARGSENQVAELRYSLPIKSTISFPSASSDETQFPAFILGAARSGTTAIMQALRSHTRYKGPGEGHVLELAAHLHLLVKRFYAERRSIWEPGLDTLLTATPERFMVDAIQYAFMTLARDHFRASHWLDKTPTANMIAAAPILANIWPNSKFIFCKRRGIENIASRLRRMPNISFETHCREWSLCMSNWLAVRETLASRTVEVEQVTLARHPELIVNKLKGLLSLNDKESDLMTKELSDKQHEITAKSNADIISLELTRWSDSQISIFMELCGPMMEKYGYSLDHRYLS